MLTWLIFLVSFSCMSAAPIKEVAEVKLLSYENNNDGSGNYNFSYETSDGVYRSETGTLKKDEKTNEVHLVVEGTFSYIDPEGVDHFVRYTADENGYKILPREDMVVQSLPANVIGTLLG